MANKLFEPITIGESKLNHRIAMAPLTRYRATDEYIPSDLAVKYYEQRSSTKGTLIVSEGTFIHAKAGGEANVPGIWKKEQIQGWKKIVDKVHANGSYIYLQLWALGRAAKLEVLEKELGKDNARVVSSSDIPLEGGDKPEPLSEDEIKEYVEWYAQAARNFIHEANGDGVEVLSAQGCILDQFLQTNANRRADSHGGSVKNRTKFTLQVVDAISKAVGESKTAIRLSPFSTLHEMRMPEDDIKKTFSFLIEQLKVRHPKLAYLHLVLPRVPESKDDDGPDDNIEFLTNIWKPLPILLAGELTAKTALEKAEKYENSVAVFGRYFISNPDLPLRIQKELQFTPYNRDTFYLAGPTQAEGYTDYPFLNEGVKNVEL